MLAIYIHTITSSHVRSPFLEYGSGGNTVLATEAEAETSKTAANIFMTD